MHHRAFRHPTDYKVYVTSPAGAVAFKLIDVSNGGARLKGEAAVFKGELITIKVLGHNLPALVRWVGGGRIGVAFRPQLTQTVMDIVSKCVGTGRTQARFDSSTLQEMR